MSYTIVALPEDSSLMQLNSIKNYLYLNNFRYTIKTCQENAHITLLHLDGDIPYSLQEDIQKPTKGWKKQSDLRFFYIITRTYLDL